MGPKARAVKFYSTVSDRPEVIHLISALFSKDGGPGSGNFGHKGRPGKVGGSGEGSEKEIDPTGAESPDSTKEIKELRKRISKMSRFGMEGKAREDLTKILHRLEAEENRKEMEKKGYRVEPVAPASKITYAKPPESAKTLTRYPKFAKGRNSAILNDAGIKPEDVQKATETLSEVFNKNQYGMFIDADVFLKNVVYEHFKNQYETGTSMGTLSTQYRNEAAEKLFGMENPDDVPGQYHEKYGALVQNEAGNGCNSGFGYGNLAVTFKKDRLAGKVTYTLTDSLTLACENIGPTMAAGSVSIEETTFGGAHDLGTTVEFLKNLPKDMCGDLNYIKSQLASPYIELQYHGDLTIDDVATICFKSEDDLYRHLTEEDEKSLKARGIRVGFRGGNFKDEFIEV